MRQRNLNDLDRNLADELADSTVSWEAWEADYEGATVSGQCYHIVFSPVLGRGGIVFVGSGSSGETFWTDASSAQDVLDRHLTGDMAN